MNWQPTLYSFSFGTLIAGIVGGVSAPFCRKREPGEKRAEAARRPAGRAERDRVAEAMRNWREERAQTDLAYAPASRTMAAEPAVLAVAAALEEQSARAAVAEAVAEPVAEAVAEPAAEAVTEPAGEAEPAVKAKPMEDPRVLMEEPASSGEEPRKTDEPNPFLRGDGKNTLNFYEILQISPRADLETIHRVYRIMAARFHPDNPVSGDHERFLELCEAYEVLSRPERRAQYDCVLRAKEAQPMPIFEMRVFVDGLEGEVNRRFGILALLYQRRRVNPAAPGVSALELEQRMSLPREHLEFTLWYLRSKAYLHIVEDNSDYAITATGIDYVERNLPRNPIVRELLKSAHPEMRHAPEGKARRRNRESRRDERTGAIILAG